MKRLLLASLAAASLTAHAGDLDRLGTLAQGAFRDLSADLAAAASYKGVTPATPLGALGIDIGVEVTSTDLKNASAFRQAGADASRLTIPKLHIHKGLIGGLDIGGFVSSVNGVGATLAGVELRYAVLDDGLATPAFGLRASGTRLIGVDQLSFSTLALDAMLSKKLTIVTPYVGAGIVRANSEAKVGGLREESFDKSRLFVGVNVNLVAANLAVEAEKMGSNTSLSAKVGFRF